MVKSFRLPSAVERPLQHLIRTHLLKEAVPIFARAEKGRARGIAGKHAAFAFASSVQDSENEDYEGSTFCAYLPLAMRLGLRKS
jgi:hypothetical protein